MVKKSWSSTDFFARSSNPSSSAILAVAGQKQGSTSSLVLPHHGQVVDLLNASSLWTEAARLLSQRFRFCKNNGTFLSIILNRHRPVKINFQFLLVVSTLGLER